MEEKRKRRKPGEGGWTRDGYIRLKTREMQHRYVWRKHNGPVPPGKQIHHKNGDKTDNRIENLELVDCLTHKRLHSNCELRGGVWFKKCPICKLFKEIGIVEWYIAKEGWPKYGRCRKCHNRLTGVEKRERKLRRRQQSVQETQAAVVTAAPIPNDHATSTYTPLPPTSTDNHSDPNVQSDAPANAPPVAIPEHTDPNSQSSGGIFGSILSLPSLLLGKLREMKNKNRS